MKMELDSDTTNDISHSPSKMKDGVQLTYNGKESLQGEECVRKMQEGSEFLKTSDDSKSCQKLFCSLDAEMMELKFKSKKKKENQSISVSSISEIHQGSRPETIQRKSNPNCCVTIAYGQPVERLCLVAGSPRTATLWSTGISYLIDNHMMALDGAAQKPPKLSKENWVRQTFEQADKNGDGRLNVDEIMLLMRKLNINLSRRKAKKLFREADSTIEDSDGYLVYDEFISFYRKVAVRGELVSLTAKISGEKKSISTSQLHSFLQTEQSMKDITEETCLGFIEEFEPDKSNKQNRQFGIEGFTNFLQSSHCDVTDDEQVKGHHEAMTKPLSHYFINSSHNTYLVGDQLTSHSSSSAYAKALSSGCRCVELDCWDGPSGEPIIHHGYTFTSKISFYDVIKVIDTHAFATNPYPVILSIENHCGLAQQRRMAEIMKEVFGEKLNVEYNKTRCLPSPHFLKNKILIKCKKLSKDIDPTKMEGEVSPENSEAEDEEESLRKKNSSPNEITKEGSLTSNRFKWLAPMRRSLRKNILNVNTIEEEGRSRSLDTSKSPPIVENAARASSSNDVTAASQQAPTSFRRKLSKKFTFSKSRGMTKRQSDVTKLNSNCTTSNGEDGEEQKGERRRCVLSRHLSDLVVYTRSIEFPGFDASCEGFVVCSFNENRAQNLVTSRPLDMVKVNHNRLSRIYPSSLRVSSSNFNPVYYWNAGCQLVALNHQTKDRNMQLNDAMFELNGGFGYVPKPKCLIHDNLYNPLNTSHPQNRDVMKLSIYVISGQQLPKPPNSVLGERGEIIDPFVEVEVIGVAADCSKKQTSAIDDNGFNPIWNEKLQFQIWYPELAFVRFVVWDSDPIGRDFIGQRTIALKAMTTGYRHIHLCDQECASIFVKITKEFLSPSITRKVSKFTNVASRLKKRTSSLTRLSNNDSRFASMASFSKRINSDSGVPSRDENDITLISASMTRPRGDIMNGDVTVIGEDDTFVGDGAHKPSVPSNGLQETRKSHDVITPSYDDIEHTRILAKHRSATLPTIRNKPSVKICVKPRSKEAEDTHHCDVIEPLNYLRQSYLRHDKKMTQLQSKDKPKPNRISSYFSKLLRKKKKHSKRSYIDSNNDVMIDDVRSEKKRSKTNNVTKRGIASVGIELRVATGNTPPEMLPSDETIENVEISKIEDHRDVKSSSPVLTSTPIRCDVYNKNSNNSNNAARKLNIDFSPQKQQGGTLRRAKDIDLKRSPPTDLALVKPADIYAELLSPTDENNDPTQQAMNKDVKTDFIRLIRKRSREMQNQQMSSFRRTKSFSEKLAATRPRDKTAPSRPALTVFNPNSPPRKITTEQRSCSVGNVSCDVIDGPDVTMTYNVADQQQTVRRAPAKRSPVHLDKVKMSPKLKCTSLLDLTSRHLEQNDNATVSKMIAQKCSASPCRKPIRRENSKSACSKPDNKLAEQIMKLTAGSSQSSCSRRARKSPSQQRPKSMMEQQTESDYVMLTPISNNSTEKSSLGTKRVDPMLSRRLSLRKDSNSYAVDRRLTQAKSLGSLKPDTYGDAALQNKAPLLYNSQAAVDSLTSPTADYRAQVEELLTKLRRSLKDNSIEQQTQPKNVTRSNNAPSSRSYFPGQSVMTQSRRSKSVEPITAHAQWQDAQRSSPPGASSEADRVHHMNRSRNRARNIAKRFNMFNSNENIPSTSWWGQQSEQAMRGNDDYVYLSQDPTVERGINHSTHSGNHATNYGSYQNNYAQFASQSRQPQDRGVIMTSRSSDYYHLNLFVTNPRPNPDGAESATQRPYEEHCRNYRSSTKDRPVSKRPQIYYALDV